MNIPWCSPAVELVGGWTRLHQQPSLVFHRKARLAKLLVQHLHETSNHARLTALLSILSHSYHLVGTKRLIHDSTKACVMCRRSYARTTTQVTGRLPSYRSTPGAQYTCVGADFAVHFRSVEVMHANWPQWRHTYAFKVVHLKPVGDLNTASFIACLKRFTSRRGWPHHLFTDNGTNFVGAKRELEEIQRMLENKESADQLDHFLVQQRIKWSYIPGRAPHFGGIWEAGVKEMKSFLIDRWNACPDLWRGTHGSDWGWNCHEQPSIGPSELNLSRWCRSAHSWALSNRSTSSVSTRTCTADADI